MYVITLDKVILARLKERLSRVEGLSFTAIFGSLAKRGFSTHDIDVAVAVDDSSLDKYKVLLNVVYAIADTFNVDPEAVNVVDLERAGIDLKKRVLDEGVVLIDKGYLLKLSEEVERLYPEYYEGVKLSIGEWLRSKDPTMIDVEVVKKRLDFIRGEAGFLREYVLSKSVEEVASSPILRRLLERGFQLIIEAIVDTCRHVVSAKGWGPAYTSRDFVLKCGERGVIEPNLSKTLVDMIVIRNIIVRRYLEVDYTRLYAEGERLMKLAEDFEKQIVSFLRKEVE